MIEAKDLTKSFGSHTQVLRGVSLSVPDGAFTVILGASGSGKSTLLNILSGLERPDGGSVCCDGVELTALPSAACLPAHPRPGGVFQPRRGGLCRPAS